MDNQQRHPIHHDVRFARDAFQVSAYRIVEQHALVQCTPYYSRGHLHSQHSIIYMVEDYTHTRLVLPWRMLFTI
jgi:hypothetical protein